MPQAMNRRQNTTHAGYQAGSGYVPTRTMAGTGTSLSGPPSGQTITVAAQDILDQISTTQGVVLFRGKDDWQALGPGTKGDVVTAGGAKADVTFSTPTTGTVTSVGISSSTLTVSGTVTKSGNLVADLADRSISTSTFGDATHVAAVTFDKYGVLSKSPSSVAITFPPVGVASVTFGTGAPGGTPAAGDLYFDDTLATYSGYVGRSGTWHKFS